MTTPISFHPALSQRLKTETEPQHLRMHHLMELGQPFANRVNYAAFVAAQYLFQRDVEHLFADPAVKAAVPDLDARGRGAASLGDLADLGAAVPHDALASIGVGMPQALGWLYVSEGSTLGAAFLVKEAERHLGLSAGFGARNLAAYPEGRAKAWRRFVASLDDEALPQESHDAVIEGAFAAYDRFGELLQRHFGLRE
ncbi:MAG: biliverdin-producing heme oxygenase [Janthinobacterium lividum]